MPRQAYGCFSNFSRHEIEMDGKIWKTSEHYYQAQKTTDPTIREIVRNCPTPKEAAQFGRSLPMREDWDEIKYDIMRTIITAKVYQHPNIKELLLSTGEEELVENSPKDYIWGCGRDGSGCNELGKIFMEVRAAFKEPQEWIGDVFNELRKDLNLDEWP